MDTGVLAEAFALAATALAAVGVLPQLTRLRATRDLAGVSLTAAVLGVATEVAWTAYAVAEGLWSAIPETMLMTVANALIAVTAIRAGASPRRAVLAGGCWALSLGGLAALAGPAGLGTALGGSYLVQVTPAVWSVYRTATPTGVAAATWAMLGVEALLWGGYGLAHRDPATLAFAVTALTAATAVLARKATSHRRHGAAAATVCLAA